MSWEGIVGHDQIVEQFRRCLAQRRLATTFLFVGRDGIGKRTFALKLAQAMLCSRSEEKDLAPCNVCAECQQVMSDTHPDLQFVAKPKDRAYIPVSTFIGERDQKSRGGMCHFISLTPSGGKRRIAIIDDADWLNLEGANSLLKTLEEPSPGAVIILISTSLQRQLPTIRSRSQVVQFHPLTTQEVQRCLAQQGFDESVTEQMAARGDGSVSQAIQFSEEAQLELRQELWQTLASKNVDRHQLTSVINEFVEAGTKDSTEKRRRLRLALQAAIDFYREAIRVQCDVDAIGASSQRQRVQAFLRDHVISLEVLTSLVERCIEAVRQTNANGQLNLIVDALAADLANATWTGRPLLLTTID